MPIFWKHRVCLFSLLRFFDELFDIINDDPLFDVDIAIEPDFRDPLICTS